MIKNYLANKSQKYASKWLVLAIDLMIVGITFFLAYFIRFNCTLNFDITKLWVQLPVLVAIAAISFLIVGSYKGVIRHTGFKDVMNLFNAISLLGVLTISFILVNNQLNIIEDYTIPISILIIHSLLSFVVLSASRLAFKLAYKKLHCLLGNCKKVMIYGAGDSGIITYNALINNLRNRVTVVAYIDDDPKKIGKQINGVPILASNKVTSKYIYKNAVDEIVIAIQGIKSKKYRELIENMVKLPTKIKVVPPIEKWINGELSLGQIKQVQIEDLLERDPIQINNPKLQQELQGEVVLVTGAAGSIGSELARQIAQYDVEKLILLDQAESPLYDLEQNLKQLAIHKFKVVVADIRDKNRVDTIFQKYNPSIVFHAAAYKHVPLMEATPYEAIKINVLGTKTLTDTASRYKIKKFVFVSTDKAVNPTSVMGATKRIAEMYISCVQQESKTRFIITRFGNVLGSNGSVIPLFKKQIENGGPLTVTHKDVTRYFMTIPEASQLVLEAGAMGKGGEIFIFDMGAPVKIYDLALNMIKLSGLKYPQEMAIKITGLRPGEKLYEELLANGENTLPTYHKKIMISKTKEFPYTTTKSDIEELCIANRFQSKGIVKKMKELVPEYQSKNSKYEIYDKNTSIIEARKRIMNGAINTTNYTKKDL
ncbi:nucleoside-diphosphate sugar epimerase/dehydratase [Leptobacterium sp. I13]|uniref:polysaccharide biosynthesis protein n=1 Tax=Leptobacterium meishanense TaxID=3128904 RepID=UPI0030EE6DDF